MKAKNLLAPRRRSSAVGASKNRGVNNLIFLGRDSERFRKIPEIPKDSERFREIPKDSGRFRKIPEDSERFGEIPRDSEKFREIMKDSKRFLMIPTFLKYTVKIHI